MIGDDQKGKKGMTGKSGNKVRRKDLKHPWRRWDSKGGTVPNPRDRKVSK